MNALSPFPGMDPYLEGYLWPDVHNSLAFVLKELLGPKISPKYVARIELYTVDDHSPESEVGIMYPDVEILQRQDWVMEPEMVYAHATAAFTMPNVSIPTYMAVPVRIPVVEIRDVAKNRLVTAIEVLSPVNKKKPGMAQYEEKRLELHRSGVHLLEIDLLRRGNRPLAGYRLPHSHYAVLLTRAGARMTDAWTLNIQDKLPILPIPLAGSDPDVTLDLQAALDLVYARSLYHLSVDYTKDPPSPTFAEGDKTWMKALLAHLTL